MINEIKDELKEKSKKLPSALGFHNKVGKAKGKAVWRNPNSKPI